MTTETLLTVIVPSMASLAYASAGIAHFFITKNYPMNKWEPIMKENQKLVYTFYALDPPADFVSGYPLNV